MNLLKEYKTEFGNVAFIGDSAQGELICITVSPEGEFTLSNIDKEDYQELISDPEIIYFSASMDNVSFTGTFLNNQLTLNNQRTSLFQEHYDESIISDFKRELVSLSIAAKVYFNQPEDTVPDIFKVPYNRIKDTYFTKKLITPIDTYSFASLITGRIYTLEMSQVKDPEYTLNWQILENSQLLAELITPPVKWYTLLDFKKKELTTLPELWDAYLIKQFGIALTLSHAPESWINEGYVHALGLMIDPIIHLSLNERKSVET